jgi:aminomethyltransferase
MPLPLMPLPRPDTESARNANPWGVSTMTTPSKKTPLYDWHLSNGAKTADFGGYSMPLWYSSAKNEHLSVLTRAGLFDTSHMAVVLVDGSQARNLLQECFTKDLDACIGKDQAPIQAGRCIYGAFLNHAGGVIDDAIVYQRAEDHFMVVVNAGMGKDIAAHLEAFRRGRNAQIADKTDRLGKIDIQGPLAARILTKVIADAAKVFDTMPYFSFKGSFEDTLPVSRTVQLIGGAPILLSRTGYTGEFGFELFMAADRTRQTWEAILKAGAGQGLVTCGLAARDSLRGGAALPLSHQDIGTWPFINHPWEFALPIDGDTGRFTKPFVGDAALLKADPPQYTVAFAGQDLRKVSTRDPAVVLDKGGNRIGTVLTCVSDMGIDRIDGRIVSIASPDKPPEYRPRGLSCGFIKINRKLDTGATVQLKDNRRTIAVTIVDDVRPDRTARCKLKEML